MKATVYFIEQVLPRRSEIDPRWCLSVKASPFAKRYKRMAVSAFGVKFTARVMLNREFCDLTLSDEITIHNAFFDCGFRREQT